MTNDEINDIICKWMGWIEFPYPGYAGGILLPYKWSRSPTEHAMEKPRYVDDLNLMREAWLKLTCNDNRELDNTSLFAIYLAEIVRDDINPNYKLNNSWIKDNVTNSTALQRAKALVKVLNSPYNKWTVQ